MNGTISKQELFDRIQKVQNLHDRAATSGEKAAAESRLNEMKSRYKTLFGEEPIKQEPKQNPFSYSYSSQTNYSWNNAKKEEPKQEPKKEEPVKEPTKEYKFDFENQTIKNLFINFAHKKMGLYCHKKKYMRKDDTYVECTREQYIKLTLFLNKINTLYREKLREFSYDMMAKEGLY